MPIFPVRETAVAVPEPEPPVIEQYPKTLYKVEVHQPPPPPPQPAPEVVVTSKVVNDEEEERKAKGEGWSKDVPKLDPDKDPKGPYVPTEPKTVPAHNAGHDEKKK